MPNDAHLPAAVVAWLADVSGFPGTAHHLTHNHRLEGNIPVGDHLDEAGVVLDTIGTADHCAICNPAHLPPPIVMEIHRWNLQVGGS